MGLPLTAAISFCNRIHGLVRPQPPAPDPSPLPGGTVVNQEIIRAGFAWVCPTYCKKPLCLESKRLESEAATAKLGLWQDKNPLPPWEWRREERDKR
jgi:endonuclease YncB( thermonuclease family)